MIARVLTDRNSMLANQESSRPPGFVAPPHAPRRQSNAASRSRQRCWTFLRVLVTLALLWLLLRRVAVDEVTNALGAGLRQWPFLLVALALPAAGGLVAALRWKVLLAAQGMRVSVVALWEAILVGAYYNQFLPSTIGGDVARVWWIAGHPESASRSSSTYASPVLHLTVVGVDRLIGLLGMCATAFLAAIVSPSIAVRVPGIWSIFALVIGGISAAVVLPYLPIRTAGKRLFSLIWLRKLRDKADIIYAALKAYRGQKSRLLQALLLSIGLQLLIVLQFRFLAAALNIQTSIWALAVVVPLVNLVSMIPVTINGIGIRENALALLGALLGLSAGGAVALAWAFLAAALLYVLLGGLVCLRGRKRQELDWNLVARRSIASE